MTKAGTWIFQRPHVSGALLALVVALAIFGQRLEERLIPVLSEVRADEIERTGDRLFWNLHFCKLRDARLDQSAFTFFYVKDPMTIAVPIVVTNESRKAAVGETPLPEGCFNIRYSAEIPTDAEAGDRVIGLVWYHSSHPFWRVREEFGVVPVPVRGRHTVE